MHNYWQISKITTAPFLYPPFILYLLTDTVSSWWAPQTQDLQAHTISNWLKSQKLSHKSAPLGLQVRCHPMFWSARIIIYGLHSSLKLFWIVFSLSRLCLLCKLIYYIMLFYFLKAEIFSQFVTIFFKHSINVASKAINQQVAPFLAISLVSTLMMPSLDKMERLSNIQ